MARRIRVQQTSRTIHKIRYPKTNASEEIEGAFEEYFRTLYTQPAAADEESIKTFLEGLDLPSIGEGQNQFFNSDITEEEVGNAISRTRNSKSPGSDGFPSEFDKVFRQELNPLLLA